MSVALDLNKGQPELIELQNVGEPLVENVEGKKPVGPILTKEFILEGGLAGLAIAGQAVANRLLGNNTLTRPQTSGWTLFADLAFVPFIGQMVKGCWRAVDSVGKQFLVIGANIGTAAACDALAYFIPVVSDQKIPLGQATLIAGMDAIGLVSSMATAKILNSSTHRGPKPEGEPSNINVRRALTGGLVVAVASGSAVLNRLVIDSGSPIGVVLNMAASEVQGRFSFTVKRVEKEFAARMKFFTFYWALSMAADAAIGAAIPSSIPYKSPLRYISGTGIGSTVSFIRISAGTVLDHFRNGGKSRKERKAEEDGMPEKPFSCTWKLAAAGALSLAIPAAAALAYRLPFVSESSTVSLGVKMAQNMVTGLAVREMIKTVPHFLPRIGISLIPAGLAAAIEQTTQAIKPISAVTAALAVTSMAIGNASKFLGMAIKEKLLGRDNDE